MRPGDRRMKWHLICSILILIVLISFCGCVNDNSSDPEVKELDYIEEVLILENITGYTYEYEMNTTIVAIDVENIIEINFTLTWYDDEMNTRFLGPLYILDEFDMAITPPDNNSYSSNKQNSTDETNHIGSIHINYTINGIRDSDEQNNYPNSNGKGDWVVQIKCLDAPGCYRQCMWPYKIEDEGNSWTLSVIVRYYR